MNMLPDEAKLNRFLDETMELNDLPGLAVGVSIGGISTDDNSADSNFEYIGCRGYRDYDAHTPLRPDDIFHCASVSKLFTSAAIMKLVEAGAFGLYDRLCDILPSLGIRDERFREIRLWNMLTHTSGLGDVDDYHWDCFETDDDSLSRYVYGKTSEIGTTEVLNQPMLWYPQCSPEFYGVPETDENGDPLVDEKGEPLKLFRYSNVAYEILGQIVAEYSCRMPGATDSNTAVRKLSYEDFVSEYLLKPACMTDSTMKTFDRCDFNSPAERELHDMASPHMKNDIRQIVSVDYYPYTRYHSPSSTLTSNVPDLLKWGRAHLNAANANGSADGICSNASGIGHSTITPVLQRETYDSIWRDYATVPNNGEKMGLGWFIRKQNEFTLYGHEGTDDGFRASFWICPELEMVTVVLSNLSGAPVKKINRKMFETIVR